jgi:hypothetical protein
VVCIFLGTDWVRKYADPHCAKKRSIFTLVESPLRDKHRAVSNYFHLAEDLYNLQTVLGFDECIERFRNGDIESGFAELEFGGMLRRNGISFRYVVPVGTLGRDYDVEILHPRQLKICADAKCKI